MIPLRRSVAPGPPQGEGMQPPTNVDGTSAGPRRPSIATLPWYPVAFAAAYVLNLWVESGVSVFAITRSLLISRGALGLLAVLVLAAAIPLALVLWGRIRRTPLSWPRFTSSLNAFSGFLLLVVLVGGASRGTYPALVADLLGSESAKPPGQESDANDRPDILILLLDGYPGDESFTRLFGGDNRGFGEELEARGFEVIEDARSNYTFTQATLTSMLHMRPLHEIADLAPIMSGESRAYPLMRVTLNHNPAFDLLRDRGYRVITSSSGYEHVTMRGADEFLDDGSLNEVERHLIRLTTLHRIIDIVAPEALPDQHRQRIIAGFDFFRRAGEELGHQPTFALIHVPSPHPPVVLDGEGDLLIPPPREGVFDGVPIAEDGRAAYRNQLAFINREALAALDDVDSRSSAGNEPIIIVMSDHGAAPQSEIAEGRVSDDHYANYFAIRTPGGVQPALSVETTPVNVLATLFNTYLGTDYPMWPDERFPAAGFGGPTSSFR
jgi:hypothetical protein